MQIALYQPDIAANLGSLLRFSACMGVLVHVIEPCGFPLDEKRIRRAGMDYIDMAQMVRHASWEAFHAQITAAGSRLLLMTTRGSTAYHLFEYEKSDVLLMGRESAGVPETVHAVAGGRLFIPMQAGARSLNVVQAACIVAAEAMRQTHSFPTQG